MDKQLADEIVKSPENHSVSYIFELLKDASDAYYNAIDESELILTDQQYDSLERWARNAYPTNEYFIGVGADVRGAKVKLPYPMGGLEQAYDGDTERWIINNNLRTEKIIAAKKYDGTSAMIIYDQNGDLQIAFSRGKGDEAADITRHIRAMKKVPKKVNTPSLVVRAEVEVTEQWFNDNQSKLLKSDGTPYKNARNYVSGQMNCEQSTSLFYDNVDVIAYTIISPRMNKGFEFDVLKENGFTTADYLVFEGHVLNDTMLTQLVTKWSAESPWALDGVVLTVHDLAVQQHMEEDKKSDSLRVAWARKFKVNETGVCTTVRDIELNISKHGQLKPVVIFDPILLSGATCSRATAFNAEFVYKNQLGPGAKIEVLRSGQVIPYITRIVSPMPVDNYGNWFDSKFSEFGDYQWNGTGVDIELVNTEDNDTVAIKQNIAFFKSMEVELLSDMSVETLYNRHYKTIESIICETPENIEIALGSINGRKGAISLREKLNPVPLWKLAGSGPWFGSGLGKRKFKALYDATGKILDLTVDEIIKVDGFELKTAQKIVDGYADFKQFLKAIDGYWTEEIVEKVVDGKLIGKYFVFTGVRSKELEDAIQKQGGECGTSFTKITHLVCKEKNSTSEKAKKARAAGAEILSLDEAWKMI